MDKCLCVNGEIVFGCAELEGALKQHGCRLIEIGEIMTQFIESYKNCPKFFQWSKS